MNYGYKKNVKLQFSATVEKVREELSKEGFGILTEINVRETLKKKLDVDFDNYSILGACNPAFAHKALMAEKDIGLLLPCNVIVYEENRKVYVSVILPSIAMNMVENKELCEVAYEVEKKLKKAIDSV